MAALLLSAVSLGAAADNVQTLTINGETSDKTVARITFSGDDATLSFSDNTSATFDMELVKIEFSNTTVGINAAQAQPKQADKKVYNLNGQYIGNGTAGLKKGVYVVEGKKVVIK